MRTVLLGEVAQINPKPPRISEDTEVAFVGMADLDATQAKTSSGQVRRFLGVSKGYTVFQNADILVAKITPCFENNKIGQARLQRETGVGSTEFHVIRPGGHLDDRYLLHFLRQDRIRRQGEVRMTGSAGQRRVPVAFLQELKIPLPSLDEQRRIAAILDQADKMRDSARLAQQDVTLAEATVTRQFFDEQAAADRLPLESASEKVVVGHVGPTTEYFTQDGVPFLRTGNIGAGQVSLEDIAEVTHEFHARLKKSQLKTGDVLISRVISDRVRSAILPPELDGANCANIIVVRPSQSLRAEVITGYLSLPETQYELLGRKVGSAQSVVNTGVLKSLLVPVPSIDAQRAFCEVKNKINRLRTQIADSERTLSELFASLQTRAFAGQL